MEIEALTASKAGRLCGFQAAVYVSGLNQNQPNTEIPATGMMTPQAVKLEMRPVILAPLKLRTVQIQRTAIVKRQVSNGVVLRPKSATA